MLPSPFSGTAAGADVAASSAARARRICGKIQKFDLFSIFISCAFVSPMASAPATGFYFDPIGERLALLLEGAAFPSEGERAYVGDPVEMSPYVSRLAVAMRRPGIDAVALD